MDRIRGAWQRGRVRWVFDGHAADLSRPAGRSSGNRRRKTADRIFKLFEDLVSKGKTFMMVTHDVGLAKRIPRVIEVLDGELHESTNGFIT